MAKNKILEDHAFFNSHKLRKPVSSILGLIQLLGFDLKSLDKIEIFKTLKKGAKNMDNVIQATKKVIFPSVW